MSQTSLLDAAAFTPYSLAQPNSWVGHLPFAAWLVKTIAPRMIVELGTHSGNSYFGFCQAVVEKGLSTKCYAVDTWQGDEHAGYYGEDIFAAVNAHNTAFYASFSRLLRMTFDEAAAYFSDHSIDLLHIDGLHTYEAVRHDFNTWLPKLAPGAVVMFHDTNVRERGFGVWKLWEELQEDYPSNLEFGHSHGLGVLQLNNAPANKTIALLDANSPERQRLFNYFSALGALSEARGEAKGLAERIIQRDNEIATLADALSDRDNRIISLGEALSDRDNRIISLGEALSDRDNRIISLGETITERECGIVNLGEAVAERDGQIASLVATIQEIHRSTSWRLLAPLRWLGRQRQRLVLLARALPSARRRAGGLAPLFRFAFRVWRTDGLHGLKAVARQRLLGSESFHAAGLDTAAATGGGFDAAAEATDHSSQPAILFVSHEATRTGAPIFLLEAARILKQELGITCGFLLRTGGELEERFRALGPTLVLGGRELDPLTLNALKQRQFRLVYSNTVTNGHLQRQLKKLGCPILCHVHELGYSIESHFGEENFKSVMAATDRYLAGSRAVASYLTSQWQLPPEKVRVAHPFIDVSANRRAVEACPAPLDLPANAIIVGACGTIGWRKGTDLFLQVAKQVLERTPSPVHFVWVGGPLSHGDYGGIRYDASLLGIAEHLSFPGAVDAHLPYLRQFDIFALPSREDPFPLVALDAASLGIPVVCFDQAGGTPELVEADAGIVAPYLDVERMASAILALVTDAGLRRQLGEAASSKVSAHYDITIGGPHLAEIIKQSLQTASARGNT